MTTGLVITGLIALVLVYGLIHRATRPTLSKIRGPKSYSFIFGNLLELFQRPIGEADFKWQSLYGNVVRFKTVLGEDELLISDPKALQKIFHTSCYHYPKQPNFRVMARVMHGGGILWADEHGHKRQRKILLPAFGAPESKAFLTVFRGCAEAMCSKWQEIIASNGEKVVLNVHDEFCRATLDAMGEAAFDIRLDTIHNDDHPLATTYHNLQSDIFGSPSVPQLFIQAISLYIPQWILGVVGNYGSHYRLQRAREVKSSATEIAKELLREKAESLLAGKGRRDIFSLLVKANMDSEAKHKLTDEELVSQMCTVMFAGHETTANSLTWTTFELARHPKVQSRLRAEIRATEAAIRARGETEFTTADFDGMPYLAAVIKEGLRYHPVVPYLHRVAGKDDIVPLAKPIAVESGEMINRLVVPKGTQIVASISAYQRDPELWGEDAHEFNPDRWFEGIASTKKIVSVGVYANLMAFLGGARACIGWRFALVELQSFLVEVFRRYEITMTEQSEKIVRGPSDLMVPSVDGELGSQLPLVVSVACDDA